MRLRFVTGLVLVVCASCLLVVGACGDDDSAGSSEALNGNWVLDVGYGVEITEDAKPTLVIDGPNWSGSSGCNTYRTTATIDGDSVQLSPVVSTRMACPDPAMAVEAVYLQRLEQVASFDVSRDELELKDDGGTVVLGFTRT